MESLIKQHSSMLNSLDLILGSLGVYALIDTVFMLLHWTFMGTMEDVLKLLIGTVTLIYFILRAYHYFHMSALDREKKRLELSKFKKDNL